MARSQFADCPPFYARYVDLAPEDDVLSAMQVQADVTRQAILGYADRPSFRYAPGKWSVRQVVGHMADTERLFGFRALWFARADPAPLPGMEQDGWMAASDFDAVNLEEVLAGFQAARASNLLLLRQLTPDAWSRRGVASGHSFSVRALAHILLGHERAHLQVLAERYP
ncbi:DinB family protein [Deinococcus detaillensis]|uniref:DinB family protein n=1 Tax=Deinococcus detaillensis TaxID=2592048 RepID=A0A553V4M6_9DEIO|nr:DinB family protein [Deinococcus detaillensis]TSA87440.1 DinB family protein [Deinococcus detaillensis]